MKMGQCVPKRRHIKFRRRGITQKKEYNEKAVSMSIVGGRIDALTAYEDNRTNCIQFWIEKCNSCKLIKICIELTYLIY
jgi:hypothetical protein